LPQFAQRALEGLRGASTDADIRSLRREPQRNRPPNPTAAPSNQRDLARQPEIQGCLVYCHPHAPSLGKVHKEILSSQAR
jgi:hypothetical protein